MPSLLSLMNNIMSQQYRSSFFQRYFSALIMLWSMLLHNNSCSWLSLLKKQNVLIEQLCSLWLTWLFAVVKKFLQCWNYSIVIMAERHCRQLCSRVSAKHGWRGAARYCFTPVKNLEQIMTFFFTCVVKQE